LSPLSAQSSIIAKNSHNNIAFVLIIVSGVLAATAYKVGDVVYKYGIGVKSWPKYMMMADMAVIPMERRKI